MITVSLGFVWHSSSVIEHHPSIRPDINNMAHWFIDYLAVRAVWSLPRHQDYSERSTYWYYNVAKFYTVWWNDLSLALFLICVSVFYPHNTTAWKGMTEPIIIKTEDNTPVNYEINREDKWKRGSGENDALQLFIRTMISSHSLTTLTRHGKPVRLHVSLHCSGLRTASEELHLYILCK